ncbi:glutathione S-transferase family protein [Vineibacter terrae]|nr:glutathione S-transferase family protein [Vineibacter terrae]
MPPPAPSKSNREAAMLKVYLDPCTVNCRKVLAGLDLMGAPFERVHVDYFTEGHKKPEFLAINPNGALPAATDGDLALPESNAILQYAADLNGASQHYPKDLKRRADVNRWMLWEAATWFPSCYVYLVEYVVKPLLAAQPDESIIEKEAPNWHRLAGILDARLATSAWLSGDGVTIADIAVAAPMHLHALQRLPLGEHPNLKRWMTEGIEQLPSWQRTQDAVMNALGPKQ